MSTIDKAVAKLRQKPPPADLTWTELKRILGSLGYREINGSGSRVKFLREFEGAKALIILHKPHPKPTVDKGAITYVVDHLEENGLI